MRHPAESFRPEAGSVPDAPGCYLFRDAQSRVVYVGKAKSLRSRVASYFQSAAGLAPRTRAMLAAASAVEWIVVDSEVDALHLEYTLIQQHRPRYNVQYRDDKSYPYLVLSTSDEVPRARVQRGKISGGDRKFGPYAHAYAIRETLDLLLPVFPVRSCSDGVYRRAQRLGKPCLLHHIERCAAPCTGEIGVDDHRQLVDGLANFLDGDSGPVVRQLEREMREASAAQEYERAGRRRDQLEATRKVLAQQQVVSGRDEDLDVVGIHGDDLEASVQVLFVRRGRLSGRKGWSVDKAEQVTDEELLRRFLVELYADDRADEIPPTVVVPSLPDDVSVVTGLLSDRRQQLRTSGERKPRGRAAVVVRVPQRGDKRQLLDMASDNARDAFQRTRLRRAHDFDARTRALRDLQEAVDLPVAPLRIECFDISHLGGTQVVASMVVFEDGLPRKSAYRRFKVTRDTNDDVAAMREVLERRFRPRPAERGDGSDGAAGPEKFALRPDLVVIDGGIGQLNAALEGARTSGADIDDVSFVALAKRYEELWLPGRREPVVLPRGGEALYLVQRLRDEAHRFAVTYQRSRRTAGLTRSALDAIPGVGPGRRQALLEAFGSAKAVALATVEDIASVRGISRTLAETIHTQLIGEEVD
ncbi:MAG: excinuclease ABC subunit UvrC [Nitriliruptoraceae bacterium]